MVCNASGKATEAKLLHPWNAYCSMVCNASGKATEAKLLHPRNALCPMVRNASGKATNRSTKGHKNALDAMIEAFVGEQKPIFRNSGFNVVMKTAMQGFFLTELRRMLDRETGGKEPRKGYLGWLAEKQLELIAFFIQSGLVDPANMHEKWNLETQSMHALAYREGAHGAAISYQNCTADMTSAALLSFGVQGVPSGKFRCFRAQAGPKKKLVLRFERT